MSPTCTTCQGAKYVDESGQGHYERCADCWGTGLSQWPRPTRLQGVAARQYRQVQPMPVRRAWIRQITVTALAAVIFLALVLS